MKSIKVLFTSICISLLTTFIFAVEVNEKELETVSVDAVVFENYTGPHSVINTADEISNIGTELGKKLKPNIEKQTTVGSEIKYQVIHAIDPTETGKLDADIFIIGSNSAVDHIKNIRRIISSYLVTTYDYSVSDANTLATFITVYNAVYRGNLNKFQEKYKKVVTNNLSSEKVGIALSYKDWPGKTQIVIPLNDIKGGLSTVDTSVISDKQVVQSMQGEDDKGVESRKEMVDIKEREADIASEKAQEAQKKATEETNKLKEEQKKETQLKQEAEEAKEEAEEAKQTAEKNPNDKELQKQAEEKQEIAEEQTKKTEEQAKKTEEAKQEATEAQSIADTKRTEAQTERTSISQDQQTIMREQAKNENAPQVYGLKAVDELGILSSLVKMNAETGSVIKESPVTVIRSRTIYEVQEGYIAIAGTNIKNGAVKLVILDKENMEIIKEGADDVAETSVLVQDGNDFYCVVKSNNKWIVGKYNSNLESLLKSTISVKPATPITITSSGILVTSASNRPILLKKDDLSLISSTNFSDAK